MRISRLARSFLWEHPLFWVSLGIPLFAHLSVLMVNSWSIEILIARNILNGYGFVAVPLDPPALWRPPLAVGVLVPIEMFVHDPVVIYRIFGTLTLVGLLVAVFYLMKMLGGNVAAHFSQLVVLTTPAITTLVSRQFTLLSYLLMFSLVTLAVLSTLRSWMKADWRRDLVMGLCWGIAFLARPEVILLFGASVFFGLVFHRWLSTASRRAGLRFVLQLASFLVVYVPAVLISKSVQTRHDLLGQEPLYTFYAGAYLANNQQSGDTDASGYIDSVARYGRPEKYHNSLLRFIIAHPTAVELRFKQNLTNFRTLVESGQVFNPWDYVAFLGLSSILVFARPPSLPGKVLVAYFTLLLLASPYFLVFHMDPRYSLLLVLILMLWVTVVSLVFWTWLNSRLPLTSLSIASMLCVVLSSSLVALCGYRLNGAISASDVSKIDLSAWRVLAKSFRKDVPDPGTPVVAYFTPAGQRSTDSDFLWFTYFSRTAMPWCGKPGCWGEFPRDKIYSFVGKTPDYAWVKDENVSTFPSPARVIGEHVWVPKVGWYSLLKLAVTQ